MELPESGMSGAPEPPKHSSSQPASASITADAPESLRNVRRSYRFMGVLLSLTKPRAHRRMGSARGREISKDQWETFSPTTSAMK